jgi:pimeloyl-ACP methyl ester carboxylesterase
MNLVYIHGAGATSNSFNFIRPHLGNGIDINYSNEAGFKNNLESMLETLKDVKDVFFVAHSLGGVYALHIADRIPSQVLGAVTMSSPYGGSEVADYVKYLMPSSRLLQDIGVNSWPIQYVRTIDLKHPWCNIVTVKGQNHFMLEANDGVVSIASQRARKDMELIEIGHNHYEVVLSDRVVKLIKERIKKV